MFNNVLGTSFIYTALYAPLGDQMGTNLSGILRP